MNHFPSSDPLSQINISGDEDLQLKIRKLCYDFRDIFSDVLSAEPAKIPPFNLKVDDSLWSVPKNRTPPRPQSTANQVDIVKQITELEKAGIIEKSQSPYYSQVLMVPKPDGSKRMCIDYRNLNDCTPDASWPIPNIAEMLRRIENQNPKFLVPWTLLKDTIKLQLHEVPELILLSANSWEPYSSLRDVVVLHDYLKLKKLHRLLNKQHR